MLLVIISLLKNFIKSISSKKWVNMLIPFLFFVSLIPLIFYPCRHNYLISWDILSYPIPSPYLLLTASFNFYKASYKYLSCVVVTSIISSGDSLSFKSLEKFEKNWISMLSFEDFPAYQCKYILVWGIFFLLSEISLRIIIFFSYF